MGPNHTDALTVTVAYPQALRLSTSRVLKIPLSSLSGMMNVLHQQGAVVTRVVGTTAVDVDSAQIHEERTAEPTPPRKRGNRPTRQ